MYIVLHLYKFASRNHHLESYIMRLPERGKRKRQIACVCVYVNVGLPWLRVILYYVSIFFLALMFYGGIFSPNAKYQHLNLALEWDQKSTKTISSNCWLSSIVTCFNMHKQFACSQECTQFTIKYCDMGFLIDRVIICQPKFIESIFATA